MAAGTTHRDYGNEYDNSTSPPIPRRTSAPNTPTHHYENTPNSAPPKKKEIEKRLQLLTQMSMSDFQAPTLSKRKKQKKHLKSGTSIAFSHESPNKLVVADEKSGKVMMFSESLHLETELIADAQPFGVVFVGLDTVAVTDVKDGSNSVKLVSVSTGRTLGCCGTSIAKWTPRGVTVTKHDHIVVTNIHKESSQRATIFTNEGQEVKSFGRTEGPGDMTFQTPLYAATDIFGRILFSDVDGNCVKVFDSRGQYLSTFGDGKTTHRGAGAQVDGDSALLRPHGICCDSRGDIVVCDTGNQRVAMFSSDGRFLHNLFQKKRAIVSPIDVAADAACEKLALTVHDLKDSFRKLVLYDFIT